PVRHAHPRLPRRGLRRGRRLRRRRRQRRRRPCRCRGRTSRSHVYGIGMPAPLYFRHASSVEHDTGGHPESKARIPAIESELARRDWLGYERREAPEVALEQLERVHPRAYIEHVRDVAERGGWFDPDTVAGPGSWGAALHA